jgi:cytochrome c oxidase assembly factor CtaG
VLGQLVRPRIAFALWCVVIAVWHVPAIYDYTLTHRAVHDLEHFCFIFVGVLVWTQIVDPARRRALTVPQRVAFAAAMFATGQILSYVLIFSLQPLYPAYAEQSNRLFGWSPTFDQQLAGLAMMAEQLISLGTACAILLVPFVRNRNRYLVSQPE